jgi:two-component system chemotaxis response regulator CheY
MAMNQLNKQFEKLKVVVVDDQDTIRKAIVRALSAVGLISIEEFSDGREAIEFLRKNHVDLILCDLYMKHVSGFEVLRYLRGRDFANDIPFIVVTGETKKDEIVKANDLGAEHYVLKPFTAIDLQRVVTTIADAYLNPIPLLHHVRLAERLTLEGKNSEAKDAVQKALEIDPASPRVLYNKALLLAKEREFGAAKRVLEEIMASQPSFYRSYRLLANISLEFGDRVQAIHYLTKELEINGAQPDRQALLGNCYLELKQYDPAIERFRQALKLDMKFMPALNGIGHAFARMGNFDKGIYYFKRMRRYSPEHQGALDNIVKYAMRDSENTRKGELALKDEIGRNPERVDARLALAKVLQHRGEMEACLKIIDNVLEGRDNHKDALMMKLQVKVQAKNYDEALVIGKKLCEVAPSLDAFRTVGKICLKKGKLAEALSMCEQALGFDNKDKVVLSTLFEAYHATGQDAKAYFLIVRLMKQSPEDKKLTPQLKAIIARLRLRGKALSSRQNQQANPKAS